MGLKCAVDLLWVRPKKLGGIESYIRNLLDGFHELEDDFELWLLVSKDNCNTFEHYADDNRFYIHVCDIKSANIEKRIVWQNIHLGKVVKSLNLSKCFEPYYCKPVMGCKGIDFITTIHDLQAIHYPEYFSKGKVLWMRFSWWNTIRTSKKIVAISEFVKKDIQEHYKVSGDKITTIYNPIVIDKNNIQTLDYIEKKYSIKAGKYFFTVSSLLPHKNIGILLEVMKKIVDENIRLPQKLIISGVGGKSRNELEKKIKEYGLNDKVVLTSFIEDGERNALYKYCNAFLFPSIFEGLGMPPIEAMMLGAKVVTTKKTSLEEVTQGSANYVDDPFDKNEWIDKIQNAKMNELNFTVYGKQHITQQYLKLISGELDEKTS